MTDYIYLLGYLRRLCRNYKKKDFHSATIGTDEHGVVHISAVDNDYLSLDYQKSTEWFNIVDRPQVICYLLYSWGFHLDTYSM